MKMKIFSKHLTVKKSRKREKGKEIAFRCDGLALHLFVSPRNHQRAQGVGVHRAYFFYVGIAFLEPIRHGQGLVGRGDGFDDTEAHIDAILVFLKAVGGKLLPRIEEYQHHKHQRDSQSENVD